MDPPNKLAESPHNLRASLDFSFNFFFKVKIEMRRMLSPIVRWVFLAMLMW